MTSRAKPASSPLLWLKIAQERLAAPVAYTSLGFVVIALYFGKYLGPWSKQVLPAAVLIAVAFALMTLQRIEQRISTIGQSAVYADTASAIDDLQRLVNRDRDLTTIKIIAATGGTTLSSILPKLCRASPAKKIKIELQVVDRDSPFKRYFPPHWVSEVRTSIDRAIHEYGGGRFELRICCYSNFPVIHGIMVNDSALLVGFSAWRTNGHGMPTLSAGDRPHTLYHRNDSDAAQLFWLFEDWFQFAPLKVLHESATPG